ncbi:MAG: hypothetical protein IOB86_08020 [Phenylobacterium sp.]|uniref:hypothetical protein n=1 Tax=Phenylobacterium sp. TaxID=1871053 RepID=UPI0025DD02C5|nr:hypothetical protein [Phenylobacterium sp.]MCA3712382.1 hypothetical protein [Phenylobacterium sp.]
MTETQDTETSEFSRRLDSLFETPAPGLQALELEARIRGRIIRRRRFRAMVLGLAGLTGTVIALRSLTEVQFPERHIEALFGRLAGNSRLDLLYGSLGAGVIEPVAVAGVLALLGLAFARVLEEV